MTYCRCGRPMKQVCFCDECPAECDDGDNEQCEIPVIGPRCGLVCQWCGRMVAMNGQEFEYPEEGK